MYVIPFILTEEVVNLLPNDYLERLAACSTKVVLIKISTYLNEPNAEKLTQEIVRRVYKDRLQQEEMLNDRNLSKRVEEILNIKYQDISVRMSIEELQRNQTMIQEILENKYTIPYIAPIKGDIIRVLREDVRKRASNIKSSELKKFSEALKKYSDLFRDNQFEMHHGTIFKKLLRDRTKYEIIIRGISFMIEMKEAGRNPESWRYL